MSKETIAKNTIFLYFRMILTMLVTLYTSRVILHVLGIEDFGIYQSVGGVVALLSFVNTALSAGSSRFITFELGQNNIDRLKKTFSSVLIVHTILAIFVVLVAESVGLWFVFNKLVIAPDRMEAAVFAYHFSVATIFLTITQVPYNASIISHEKMSIYAYLSILEVLLKLAIVFLLELASWDKLKVYAILLCFVQFGVAYSYRIYCKRKFQECRGSFSFDKGIVKNILNYSSWNLITNTAAAAVTHGTTVLTNMFFNPSVVAARAIANQVNGAACQLVQNFRNAVNPQIVKRFAQDDIDGSKRLLLISTRISFFLMLFLCVPVCFEADVILRLWLGVVPEHAVTFLRLVIVSTLFQTFSQSFYTALYAKGRIRENAIFTSLVGFLTLFVIFVLFKCGFPAVSLAWCVLIEETFLALVVKPLLVIKIAGYKWKDVWMVFTPCLLVAILAIPVPLVVFIMLPSYLSSEIIRFFVMVPLSILFVGVFVWLIGLDSETKVFVSSILKKLMKKKSTENAL